MDNGFIAKFRFPDLDFVINNYTIRYIKADIYLQENENNSNFTSKKICVKHFYQFIRKIQK